MNKESHEVSDLLESYRGVGYRKRPRTWDGLTSIGIFIVNAVKHL